MAIGAGPTDVLSLVLTQVCGREVVGLAFGLGGAFVLTRFIRQLLFGVAAFDPLTFVATAALLMLVTRRPVTFPPAGPLVSIPWWPCATSEAD